MSTTIDPLARLAALDTCAVSDALDRHGVSGVLPGLHALTGSARVAGRVVPVQLGPPDAAVTGRVKRHLGAAAVDASGPGQVILVAHGGRTDCAGWGGLLSRAAAARGVTAVVVDGAVRDVAEAEEAGLPVYGACPTPVTARGRAVEHTWGEPVEVGGVRAASGDFLLADRNGVVVVPAGVVEPLLDTAEKIAATEAAMARAIEAGAPVSEVMGASYEEMTAGEH